jgi:hypothetical protein
MEDLDEIIEGLKFKTFSSEQLDEFVEKYGWVYTEIPDSKDGKYAEGYITYQVQEDDASDYFGEFVGTEEDGYVFFEY